MRSKQKIIGITCNSVLSFSILGIAIFLEKELNSVELARGLKGDA